MLRAGTPMISAPPKSAPPLKHSITMGTKFPTHDPLRDKPDLKHSNHNKHTPSPTKNSLTIGKIPVLPIQLYTVHLLLENKGYTVQKHFFSELQLEYCLKYTPDHAALQLGYSSVSQHILTTK
jgi:hypothetical protein